MEENSNYMVSQEGNSPMPMGGTLAVNYVGFWSRFIASIVDMIAITILQVGFLIILFILSMIVAVVSAVVMSVVKTAMAADILTADILTVDILTVVLEASAAGPEARPADIVN